MADKFDFGERDYKLYVLALSDDCYYIGITSQTMKHRYKQHKNGEGAAWTKLHGPKSTIKVRELGLIDYHEAEKIEDRVTYDYIKRYGLAKVRGGHAAYLNMGYKDKAYKMFLLLLEADGIEIALIDPAHLKALTHHKPTKKKKQYKLKYPPRKESEYWERPKYGTVTPIAKARKALDKNARSLGVPARAKKHYITAHLIG